MTPQQFIARLILWTPIIAVAGLGFVFVPWVTLIMLGVVGYLIALLWAIENHD